MRSVTEGFSPGELYLMLIIIDQTPVCQDLPLIGGQGCHIEGKGLHFLTQHIGRDVLQIAFESFPDMGIPVRSDRPG